ncbi:transcriptional regulator [Acinetobacter sp. LoGeW2-3]|nr:transcriptional regulator [Acinetobacter sp. LoGeW2-3]
MSSCKTHTKSKEICQFLNKKTVCKLLRISINELREQELNDNLFPRGIKSGTSKQCGVKYRYDEIINWHLRKLEQR